VVLLPERFKRDQCQSLSADEYPHAPRILLCRAPDPVHGIATIWLQPSADLDSHVYWCHIQIVDAYERLVAATGFDWDAANADKNWQRHQVSAAECEQLFFNQPLVAGTDHAHSTDEVRYYALGRTDAGRRLFVVFTVRESLIRVISARDMSRRERKEYDRA
jgi:uncharacterized protein